MRFAWFVERARPHLDQTRGPGLLGCHNRTGPGCLSSHPYKRHATAKTPAPSEEVESMNNQLFSWRSITRLALFFATSHTDCERSDGGTRSSLDRCGEDCGCTEGRPLFVTKDATLLDCPATPGGE